MRRHTEPIDVDRALVSALADNVLPTAAIGAIFAGIGLYTYSKTGAAVAIGITVVGILVTALKILLIRFHRRAMVVRPSSDAAVKRFELGHAITTWCMAGPRRRPQRTFVFAACAPVARRWNCTAIRILRGRGHAYLGAANDRDERRDHRRCACNCVCIDIPAGRPAVDHRRFCAVSIDRPGDDLAYLWQ